MRGGAQTRTVTTWIIVGCGLRRERPGAPARGGCERARGQGRRRRHASRAGDAAVRSRDASRARPWCRRRSRAARDARCAIPGRRDRRVPRAAGARSGRRDPRTRRRRDAARRLVYVSSTGVYAPGGGAWVDETWPIAPVTAAGRARVAAEARAARAGDRAARGRHLRSRARARRSDARRHVPDHRRWQRARQPDPRRRSGRGDRRAPGARADRPVRSTSPTTIRRRSARSPTRSPRALGVPPPPRVPGRRGRSRGRRHARRRSPDRERAHEARARRRAALSELAYALACRRPAEPQRDRAGAHDAPTGRAARSRSSHPASSAAASPSGGVVGDHVRAARRAGRAELRLEVVSHGSPAASHVSCSAVPAGHWSGTGELDEAPHLRPTSRRRRSSARPPCSRAASSRRSRSASPPGACPRHASCGAAGHRVERRAAVVD